MLADWLGLMPASLRLQKLSRNYLEFHWRHPRSVSADLQMTSSFGLKPWEMRIYVICSYQLRKKLEWHQAGEWSVGVHKETWENSPPWRDVIPQPGRSPVAPTNRRSWNPELVYAWGKTGKTLSCLYRAFQASQKFALRWISSQVSLIHVALIHNLAKLIL